MKWMTSTPITPRAITASYDAIVGAIDRFFGRT